VFGQKIENAPYSIQKIDQEIKIDGEKDSLWNKIEEASNFIQYYPYDTSTSISKTRFKLCHNDKFLYAFIVCENRNSSKPFVVSNLKRDFSVLSNDAIVLTLAPFLDGQNGFSFGVTPHNAQREGAVENGGGFGVTTAWDQVWFSETKVLGDYWVAEMAIPFSSIRYIKGAKSWTFNVSRIDLKNNEVSNYYRVPRNFNFSSLVFAKELNWPNPLEKKILNRAIVPYTISTSDQIRPSEKATNKVRLGVDVKLGLTPGLNLDLTYNPDFAQVDVDAQQINLTRYSLFFPERRQFFIENSDLFANFGFRQIRPFFSRQIGISPKRTIIPIQYGVRLSGKYGNNLRLGLMNVTTSENLAENILPVNYTVLALQKKVLSASNIGFIMVHDQKLNVSNNYNTVLGTEFNLLTSTNKWAGKGFIQKSIYSGLSMDKGYAHATWLVYKTLDWFLMWNHEYVSKHFNARTGFVPRIDNYNPQTNKIVKMDYWRLEPEIKRVFYPKGNRVINNIGPYIYNSSYYDSALKPTESLTTYGVVVNFQNSAILTLNVNSQYFRLFLPFSPVKMPNNGFLNGEYRWLSYQGIFASNNRKALNFTAEIDYGQYFIGNKYEVISTLNYRFPGFGKKRIPRLSIAGNLRNIGIDFKDSGYYTINLYGLKAEYTLSTTTYFTGYWQLNAQNKLMNMNLRFQWRYRPMSDLFIVYSQNWDQLNLLPMQQTWIQGGRSLAVKASFWF
jgi:hypothetical protein